MKTLVNPDSPADKFVDYGLARVAKDGTEVWYKYQKPDGKTYERLFKAPVELN